MARRFLKAAAAVLAIGTAWSASGGANGQDQAPAKTPAKAPAAAPATPPMVDIAKASYGVGMNVGRALKNDGIEFDVAALVAGLTDVLSGKESRYSEAELREALGGLAAAAQQRGLERARAMAEKNKQEGLAFRTENAKTQGVTTLPSGVQYQVLKAGDGMSPKAEEKVSVHYHGTFIDGRVFDSSVARKQPLSIGVNMVIKGWTEVLQLMKVGDKWKVVIPAEMAYGEQGARNTIPPNSTLIFEIELLAIEKP
jgi:FKBP-type peptidyl-prolyl cis-trans isomerase FklB